MPGQPCVWGCRCDARRMQGGSGRLAAWWRRGRGGGAVVGLTGEPGSVLLVRPVPPGRASLAELLFAAHPIPVGSGLEPGFDGPGVVVWELCDPAAGDEPPRAVVAIRPRELGAVVEVLGAAVVPGGSAVAFLRRLFTDVAAALRPAGYPMLITGVPRAEARTLNLLVEAGFAVQRGFENHPSGPGPRAAQGAASLGGESPAGSHEAGQWSVMWFTMEL